MPTKYQLPTPYSFQDVAQTRFYGSRPLWQGQRSNQGHIMTMHTYNPQPMSLPSINFLHLTVSEIQAGQTFPAARPPDRLPTHPDTMGENNTPTDLEGLWGKNPPDIAPSPPCGSNQGHTIADLGVWL